MTDAIKGFTTGLIPPCGGELVDLRASTETLPELRALAGSLPSIMLSDRAVCDLELLGTGGFSPLDRFMGQEDYQGVLDQMRLLSGSIFPIPVTLPVEANVDLHLDAKVALRDTKNNLLAIMKIDEVYEWDDAEVAGAVFGTRDLRHPVVAEMQRWGKRNISGPLTVLDPPVRRDFRKLRLTPTETRAELSSFRRSNVVAFETRKLINRSDEEVARRAATSVDGVLLLHPVVGMANLGDVDHYTFVRMYRALARRFPDPYPILLALLPLATRMAGPREALWHALIRRNYGASHLVVGRDHASPGVDSKGDPFYRPYAAQELVSRCSDELGIRMIPYRELVYMPDEDRYEDVSRIPAGARTASLSGTEVREKYLDKGELLPEWFTSPEVADVLAEAHPPHHRRGVCLWFTGLSGAGKSTTAEALTVLLQEHGRQVTVLDGDVVRTHLSKGLGFSKEDRDANVLRIAFVASEIARHGGTVICAAISPYLATRNECRSMVKTERFVEVFVDTPLDVCEKRDAKGLYAKARRGELPGFTGIDDVYEPPLHPEIVLETTRHSPDENARKILAYLRDRGFVRADQRQDESLDKSVWGD